MDLERNWYQALLLAENWKNRVRSYSCQLWTNWLDSQGRKFSFGNWALKATLGLGLKLLTVYNLNTWDGEYVWNVTQQKVPKLPLQFCYKSQSVRMSVGNAARNINFRNPFPSFTSRCFKRVFSLISSKLSKQYAMLNRW